MSCDGGYGAELFRVARDQEDAVFWTSSPADCGCGEYVDAGPRTGTACGQASVGSPVAITGPPPNTASRLEKGLKGNGEREGQARCLRALKCRTMALASRHGPGGLVHCSSYR
jgi:hypothetical protein